MPLTAERMHVHRASAERKLTMLCDVYRDANAAGTEVAPGELAQPDYQLLAPDVKCYAWQIVRVTQGEVVFPERESISADWRTFLPQDQDITEDDQIRNVRLPDGSPLHAGEFNVKLIIPHSLYQLLMLEDVR